MPTAQDCTIANYYTMSLWSQLTACQLPRTPNFKCRSLQLTEVYTLTWRRRRPRSLYVSYSCSD